ncbi:MAG TPA: ABC transporter permease [Streptosporangiaceae bacterium]|jgi:teichoic acid transport system permease protein|nr:ABC transporter permease [Streptosporangiaceae bacterium]
MDDRGRLTAPGSLLNGTVLAPGDEAPPEGSESLAELAARYGLRPSSARPSLVSYLRLVWQRRHFIVAYATARSVSMYTEARLGQLWQVLTPLLNSAVYYLVFGILFQANRGISNYIAFLVTGVFIFGFTERSIVVGSTVMRANLALIRALHFPRACLPLAYVLVELQQLLVSLLVLFAIVLGTGEHLTWYWLFLVPVLVMQATFNMGAALILARVGAGAQDVTQLVPFLTRIWRYFCGVMYSIASLPATLPEWTKNVLSLNPAAVYISLTRYAIMETYRNDAPGAQPYNAAKCAIFNAKKIPALQAYCHPTTTISELWLAGVGWAVLTLAVGVVYFWQAETRYGRG